MHIITMTKQHANARFDPAPQGDGAPEKSRPFFDASSLEDADGALDEFCQLLDGFNEWFARPRGLGLAERYANGKAYLLTEWEWLPAINFRVICESVVGLEPGGNALEINQRLPTWGAASDSEPLAIRSDVKKGNSCSHYRLGVCDRHRNDSVVFVEGVEFVKHPQGGIPSLVWFEPFDKPFSFVANSLHLPACLFERSNTSFDRESAVPSYLPPIVSDQVANQLVECGPQIVNNIANDGAEFDWEAFFDANAKYILSSFRIDLTDELVRVSIKEGLDGRFKLLSVAFCPFNL